MSRKSRTARGLALTLALVILGGGAAILVTTHRSLFNLKYLRPGTEGDLYRLGLRLGTVDGNSGQDFSSMFSQDPLALVFYLRMTAPDYIQSRPEVFPTAKGSQAAIIRQAAQLAAHIETAGPGPQRRYTAVFLAGYKAGKSAGQLQQRARNKILE